MGCNTIQVPNGGRDTTVDQLVMMAAECAPFKPWALYSFFIHYEQGGVHRSLNPELDVDKLEMTVAQFTERHGRILDVNLSGWMRGNTRFETVVGSMLETIRLEEARAAANVAETSGAGSKGEQKSAGTANTDKASILGEVSFDDVDGDRSTLCVSSSPGGGGNILSWLAGEHCLIEQVSSLQWDPKISTLQCPQPILPTPFTNGKIWATLVAVLEPGTDTNELLGRIRAMLDETMTADQGERGGVTLDGFP
jgi:hypothetical protein